MKERYERAVRILARGIVGKNMTVSHYILEDISSRYEKTILKELIRKVERTIENHKEFDMDYAIEEKVLEIYKNRKELL